MRATKESLMGCVQDVTLREEPKSYLEDLDRCFEQFDKNNENLRVKWLKSLTDSKHQIHELTEEGFGIKKSGKMEFMRHYIRCAIWQLIGDQCRLFNKTQQVLIEEYKKKSSERGFSEEVQQQANNMLIDIIYDDINYL